MERRTFFNGVQLRARSADGGKPGIEGYGAVFNQEYVLYDSPTLRIVERVLPGTFKRTIAESQDVRCLFNHDANNLLGRTTNQTMRLREDAKGLAFDTDLDMQTRIANDVSRFIARKDVTGCSFSFNVTKQTRTETEENDKLIILREIQDVDTYDVGPVTYPAYEGTSVGGRSISRRELRSIFPDGLPASVRRHAPSFEALFGTRGDGGTDGEEGVETDEGDGPVGDEVDGTPQDPAWADYHEQCAEHYDDMAEEQMGMSTLAADCANDMREAYSKRDDGDGDADDVAQEIHQRMIEHCDDQSDHHLACAGMNYEQASFHRSLTVGDDSTPVRSDRAAAKTKRVAGEDLPASSFLYVGDPKKTDTWALPWKFSTDSKTKSHLQNALARFNQTSTIPADEKPAVYKKLVAKAKEYGIHVSDDKGSSSAGREFELAQARSRTLAISR